MSLMLENLFSYEHREVRNTVSKLVENDLKPIASQIDEEESFPREFYLKFAQQGLIGVTVPTQYGGTGGDYLQYGIIKEELCKVSAGFGISVGMVITNFCNTIIKHGSNDQKNKYLPKVISGEKITAFGITEAGAGSDIQAIRTIYKKDRGVYIINGSKTFITNAPIADHFIILAKTESTSNQATFFICNKEMKGITVGNKLKKMGMKCSTTAEVFIDNLTLKKENILGTEGEGYKILSQIFIEERVLMSSTATGIARGSLEYVLKYANERVQFGKKLNSFHMIREMIADMSTELEIIRYYSYSLLKKLDKGEVTTREASIIKYKSSKVCNDIASKALQIMGGYGYMREYPIERFFRDARLLEIGGGTTEIQKLIIANEVMKDFFAKGYF